MDPHYKQTRSTLIYTTVFTSETCVTIFMTPEYRRQSSARAIPLEQSMQPMINSSTPSPKPSDQAVPCLTLKTGHPDCLVYFYPTRFQLQLASGEQRIDLGYSGSRLLERLLQTPGEVVTREQLLQFAWADRVVGQGSLNQQVYVLRQVLGDEKERQIIQTLPRRGYLINPQYLLNTAATPGSNQPADNPQAAAPVTATNPPTAPSAEPLPQAEPRPERQRNVCLWACAGLLLVGTLLAALLLRMDEQAGRTLGQLHTTYLGYDDIQRQALQQRGQAIEARLAQLVSSPTELYISMNDEALALLCLQAGRSARWFSIPLAQLAGVSDAQLSQCLR